ncbi:hypothetical protein CERSUDRAFT_95245 [Gelatoporia subvermispora B]|uniref:Uncharacterized protein n=1 Tax=Ceriporiopsis subvermispora (strain B) TaxID=914234 RepID=M2QXW5_CERS8|nr:hypothetical protein CERSUDRAFT_95245 [Gelatoporia subvermispora B]
MVHFYGFLLDPDWLLELGTKKGLGSCRTSIARECLKSRTAMKLLIEAHADEWCTVENVTLQNGKHYWCIALASTDPRRTVYTYPKNMPPQKLVDEMKAFLKKPEDIQAMWWKGTL